jgi:hypothetical protein
MAVQILRGELFSNKMDRLSFNRLFMAQRYKTGVNKLARL